MRGAAYPQGAGRQDSRATTRRYAEYVLVFTTLPDSEASVDQVLEAYRLRWQVELTFKRLKSIAQIGHVPKHDDQSSRAWLYGKLLVALLSQRLARVGKSISPWGYLLPQPPSTLPVAMIHFALDQILAAITPRIPLASVMQRWNEMLKHSVSQAGNEDHSSNPYLSAYGSTTLPQSHVFSETPRSVPAHI